MAKTKDIDKEKLRLDYLFEQGVNFVDRVIQINEEISDEKQERQWCAWMSELSNKDAEFWYDRTYKKNFYLTPQECLDFGVIDEIF
jgi:hypothetical protein